MSEQERAVVEAAKRWANHPSASRGKALTEAVRRLEAGTCARTAIGGEPAWPVMLTCVRPKEHAEAATAEERWHEDASRGMWATPSGRP